MLFRTEEYGVQREGWPADGRHILAQYDSDSVVVYQAYPPAIGRFAVSHGYLGGPWSVARMTWVKPGFLGTVVRSDWARNSGQEVVLAIYLRRDGFDEVLAQAVPSSFAPNAYGDEATWRSALRRSDARFQWDQDRDPTGAKQERQAIELELRGALAERYRRDWILHVENLTPLVHEQRERAAECRYHQLIVPRERVYPITDPRVALRLGLDSSPSGQQ